MARTTLTRAERDALHEDVMSSLSALADLFSSIERGDWEAVQVHRDEFRLLDDIGWNPADGRDRYELTMPAEQRARVFRHFLDRAEGALRDHAHHLGEVARDRTDERPVDISPTRWAEMLDQDRQLLETEGRRFADHDLEVRSLCVAMLDESRRA